MDLNSNINQSQINQAQSFNGTTINANYTGIDNNNFVNGSKGSVPQMNNNLIQPSPPQFVPQNNNQNFWNGNYNTAMQNNLQNPAQPNIQNQDEKEFILLDGSAPNKKKKYVFVGEIDITQPVFSLEDIRKIVSDEFDRRFGEEEKK